MSDLENFEFLRTGHFWIDAGIVGLHRWAQREGVEAILEHNKLTLSCSYEQAADLKRSFINRICTEETKNYGYYFDENSNEFKRVQKRNYRQFISLSGFTKGTRPRPLGAIKLSDSEDSFKGRLDAWLKDKGMKPDYQYGTPKAYVPTSPMLFNFGVDLEPNSLKAGNKTCSLCHRSFKIVENVSGLHSPFFIGQTNQKNFFSFLSGDIKLCSLCAYATNFAVHENFYQLFSGKEGAFFLCLDGDLREMTKFSQEIRSDNLLDWSHNFRPPHVKTFAYYVNENILLWILSLFERTEVHDETVSLDPDLILNFETVKEELDTKVLIGYTINNVGISSFQTFTRLSEIFQVLRKLKEEGRITFYALFQNFYDKANKQNRLREDFSAKFLLLQPTYHEIEDFLFLRFSKTKSDEPIYVPRNIFKFTRFYHLEVCKMEEKMVNLCQAVGYSIGERAKLTKDRGVLYSLRNAKHLSEFLATLSQIQFKLNDASLARETGEKLQPFTLSPELFKRLESKNWADYKALISIFAMNRFVGTYQKKEGDQNG